MIDIEKDWAIDIEKNWAYASWPNKKVELIKFDTPNKQGIQIYSRSNNIVRGHKPDGDAGSLDVRYNLVLLKKEYWVNVYKNSVVGTVWGSKKEALKQTDTKHILRTIKLVEADE